MKTLVNYNDHPKSVITQVKSYYITSSLYVKRADISSCFRIHNMIIEYILGGGQYVQCTYIDIAVELVWCAYGDLKIQH